MVNTGGGERTEDQFRALFAAAGFELSAAVGGCAGYHVLEGTPV
jgi:hypothetical protein